MLIYISNSDHIVYYIIYIWIWEMNDIHYNIMQLQATYLWAMFHTNAISSYHIHSHYHTHHRHYITIIIIIIRYHTNHNGRIRIIASSRSKLKRSYPPCLRERSLIMTIATMRKTSNGSSIDGVQNSWMMKQQSVTKLPEEDYGTNNDATMIYWRPYGQ